MLAWLLSIFAGALAALVAIIIAVAGLTGVDGGEKPPTPGQGHYGD